jgi:mono/diheme cytochrome c family protein
MCHSHGDNSMVPDKPIHGANFLKKYPTDEMIAQRIREGSPNGIMPAFYKDQINDRELVDLIAYVRSLTPSSQPKQPSKQPTKQITKQPTKATAPTSTKKQSCQPALKGKR